MNNNVITDSTAKDAPIHYAARDDQRVGLNHVISHSVKAYQPHKHKTLPAEKIFDAAVYGVWNYGIQTSASVAAAMWFSEYGGKPYFEKSAEWMGEHVMSKITNKTGAEAAKASHTWLLFSALITVGNLFIPPMRYVEKDKAHYVSKINDWLNQRRTAKGDAPSAEELAEQKLALKEIAEQPIQSSSSLWMGRGLGLAANYAAAQMVGEDLNVKMKKGFASKVASGLEKIGFAGAKESKALNAFSEIAFLDYGYSIISSNVVYLYSHYIHPSKKTEKTAEKPLDNIRQTTDIPDSYAHLASIHANGIQPAAQLN